MGCTIRLECGEIRTNFRFKLFLGLRRLGMNASSSSPALGWIAMIDKISASIENLKKVLPLYRRPAIMWSGGKDSMVLLHLLLERGMKMDVISFRDPLVSEQVRFRPEDCQPVEPSNLRLVSARAGISAAGVWRERCDGLHERLPAGSQWHHVHAEKSPGTAR